MVIKLLPFLCCKKIMIVALNCPTDDAFLLRFLRARKFDYERAYQLLVNYYTVRAENPDVFKDFKPSTIKHVLEDGVSTFLPKRNKDGQAVLLFRPGSVCSKGYIKL